MPNAVRTSTESICVTQAVPANIFELDEMELMPEKLQSYLECFCDDGHELYRRSIEAFAIVLSKSDPSYTQLAYNIIEPMLRKHRQLNNGYFDQFVSDDLRIEAFNIYITHPDIEWETFDSVFRVSYFVDRIRLCTHIGLYVRNSGHNFERAANLYILFNFRIDFVCPIEESFMSVFLFFAGPDCDYKALNRVLRKFHPVVTELFFKHLDFILSDLQSMILFYRERNLGTQPCDEMVEIVKTYLYKIYKNPSLLPVMIQFEWTPVYMHTTSLESAFNLLNRYFYRHQMSKVALFEDIKYLTDKTSTIQFMVLAELCRLGGQRMMNEWLDFNRDNDWMSIPVPLINLYYDRHHRPITAPFYTGSISIENKTALIDTEIQLKLMINDLEEATYISVAAEWTPNFYHRAPKISILQICSRNFCYIVDIMHFVRRKTNTFVQLWQNLDKRVFRNRYILKLAFGSRRNMSVLSSTMGFTCELVNVLHMKYYVDDISNYFAVAHSYSLTEVENFHYGRNIWKAFQWLKQRSQQDQESPMHTGLERLVFIMFGETLNESERMSNWCRRPLRPTQFEYAILEAHALIDVHRRLQDILKITLNAPHCVQHFLATIREDYLGIRSRLTGNGDGSSDCSSPV